MCRIINVNYQLYHVCKLDLLVLVLVSLLENTMIVTMTEFQSRESLLPPACLT